MTWHRVLKYPKRTDGRGIVQQLNVGALIIWIGFGGP